MPGTESNASQKQPATFPTERQSTEIPVGILEVPVRLQGARRDVSVPGQPARSVPFSEETCTVLVFENGAVIRLWANLQPGQIVVITNRGSSQDVLCRVVYVKTFPNAKSYAEVEFIRSTNGFWGVYVPQGVLKSPERAQTPARPLSVSPPPPSVSADISTLTAVPIRAAVATRPETPGLAATPANCCSQSIIVQTPPIASPPIRPRTQEKAESLRKQASVIPAKPSAHFPNRAMVLVGAAAVALLVTEATGQFFLHKGRERYLISATRNPSTDSTEVGVRGDQSAKDPAPRVSQAPIDVKTEGILGTQTQELADDVSAPQATRQPLAKEPAWASKNALLAPSPPPQQAVARVGGDAAPAVGIEAGIGSLASPSLVTEGSRPDPVEPQVDPLNSAIFAAASPIIPPIKPAANSVPDFVLDRTLKGHSGWVTGVAFSSDGRRLASGSWDQTVKFWNVPTGEELNTVGSKMKEVQALAFSRDGRWLAAENSRDTVTVWDTTTGRELHTLSSDKPLGALGSNWVYSIAFSPDGRWLASAVDDKTVRLWDVATGHAVRDLTAQRRTVIYAAFSPDGRWLASGDDDKAIGIWDVSTGQEIQRLNGHKKPIYAVVFSPDGHWLASASADKTIKVWDVGSGRDVHTLTGHTNLVSSLAFSPDGRWLASGSWDKTIRIWNVETGYEVQSLSGHDHSIYTVAFDSRGQRLASGSEDGTIKLWRLSGVGEEANSRR